MASAQAEKDNVNYSKLLQSALIDDLGVTAPKHYDISCGFGRLLSAGILYTGKTVMVEAMFGEIGSHTSKWSLRCDGKEVALSDAAKGTPPIPASSSNSSQRAAMYKC